MKTVKAKRFKLTPRQIECLAELAKPGAAAHWILQCGGAAYWFVNVGRRCTREVDRLRVLGLLSDQYDSLGFVKRATINAKGRKVLNGDGTAELPIPAPQTVEAKVEPAQ